MSIVMVLTKRLYKKQRQTVELIIKLIIELVKNDDLIIPIFTYVFTENLT